MVKEFRHDPIWEFFKAAAEKPLLPRSPGTAAKEIIAF